MKVLEVASVAVTKKEGHESCSIVDSVAILSIQIFEHVVFNNWALVHCTTLSTSSLKSNSVTECKNILILFVLKSVFIDINTTAYVCETSISEELVRFRWWVNAGSVEWLLDDFFSINILEDGNLLVVLIFLNFEHFPSKHHIDATFMTFIKSNLVCVSELIDFLIRSPELNSSVCSSTTLHLVLSHEVLVVKGVEVSTFTFVWELR